jgi:hypothetical protein
MELNQQQVAGWLRITLSASGPIAALVLSKTGISAADWALYTEVALSLLPGLIVAVWSWYRNRTATQVKLVEAIPEVATVVIKDEARNSVGELAQDPAHPNIVTETQNEADAKNGTKT